jgi:hypothetical protein
MRRRGVQVLIGLAVGGVVSASGAGVSLAATPTLSPTLDCVANVGDSLYAAYFGYANTDSSGVNWQIGDDNEITPGDPFQGQPTTFNAGSYPSVFRVEFDPVVASSITWILDGQLVTASTASTPCSAGSTGTASAVTSTSAVVSGLVDTLGSAASYQFSWGTSASDLQSTAVQTVTSDDPQLVSATLSGLAPATTYYYELIADNGRTSTSGSLESFTTLPAPVTTGATSPTGPGGAGSGGTGAAGAGSTGAGSTVTPALMTAALSLNAHVSAKRTAAGRKLGYAITALNRGSAAATGATVHLALAPGERLWHGVGTAHGCSGAALVTCRLGTIAAGARVTLSIVATTHSSTALQTLVFLTTTTADAGTTGDFVTLHTSADPRPGGSSTGHSRRDRSHQPTTRSGRAAR